MTDQRNVKQDGYQPKDGNYGYQPKSQPVEKGYQPANQTVKPTPPPKKP